MVKNDVHYCKDCDLANRPADEHGMVFCRFAWHYVWGESVGCEKWTEYIEVW